jgi:hypothetical protein
MHEKCTIILFSTSQRQSTWDIRLEKGLKYKKKIVIVAKKCSDSLQVFHILEQISQVASTGLTGASSFALP